MIIMIKQMKLQAYKWNDFIMGEFEQFNENQ